VCVWSLESINFTDWHDATKSRIIVILYTDRSGRGCSGSGSRRDSRHWRRRQPYSLIEDLHDRPHRTLSGITWSVWLSFRCIYAQVTTAGRRFPPCTTPSIELSESSRTRSADSIAQTPIERAFCRSWLAVTQCKRYVRCDYSGRINLLKLQRSRRRLCIETTKRSPSHRVYHRPRHSNCMSDLQGAALKQCLIKPEIWKHLRRGHTICDSYVTLSCWRDFADSVEQTVSSKILATMVVHATRRPCRIT